MKNAVSQKGMTLIEVLVSFAILAGILLSVLTLVGQNAQYMLSAEERLLASIATDNLVTEELARLESPRAGEEVGAAVVAGRQFAYTRTVVEVGERAVLIEYRVQREGGEQTLARATALKARQ